MVTHLGRERWRPELFPPATQSPMVAHTTKGTTDFGASCIPGVSTRMGADRKVKARVAERGGRDET
jgi:hypothetical protein